MACAARRVSIRADMASGSAGKDNKSTSSRTGARPERSHPSSHPANRAKLSGSRARKFFVPLDPSEITRQLVELRVEHRDLDAAIAALAASPHGDELRLKRMKVRKLRLKDMIAYLESKLIPDLDA